MSSKASEGRATPPARPVASLRTTSSRAGSPSRATWPEPLSLVAFVLLGVVLYVRGIVLGFVGDDFTLLDAALRYPLAELLTGRHGILGYYRPVSRELYFWWWGRVLGLGPPGFHVVNAITYGAVVAMSWRFARDLAGPRTGRLAALSFLVFPAGSALLSWVSCAQDLIALFWGVAALLLYQRGRPWFAGVAVMLAALSKETAAVLPGAVAVLEWQLAPRATARERLRRLLPVFAGLATAVAIAVAARSTWPAGTAITIWSPRQLAGAWRLPFDFLRALVPPDTIAGLAQVWSQQPALPVLIAGLAAVAAVPFVREADPEPGARDRADGRRSALLVGAALAVLAMLPVGFIVERWRGYFFSLSAVGASLVAGALLARAPAGVARALLAIAALINFGAGGIYRPVDAPWGPARHPHVNYAFFRDTGALTGRLLAALEPLCPSLRSQPPIFAAGIPPDATFESVLGPGLRVTCRDTVSRVHFLAEFTPADARRDFDVLRLDPQSMRFSLEPADTRVRALIGEGFLVHARYDVAIACFRAAAGANPDRELSYPLTVALAAARRQSEAESLWRQVSRGGQVLDAETMTTRLLGGRSAAGASESTFATVRSRVAQVLHTPWDAGAQHELGRMLLEAGRAREATFALSVAAGSTGKAVDIAWLGRGYDAMGAEDEAYAAYTTALSAGLPKDLYPIVRDRFVALGRSRMGAEAENLPLLRHR